jgi:hypothetical protein
MRRRGHFRLKGGENDGETVPTRVQSDIVAPEKEIHSVLILPQKLMWWAQKQSFKSSRNIVSSP